jgi:HNH endonuclease
MLKSWKLCECGCGEYTKMAIKTNSKRGWIKGQPLRFINGHNQRGKQERNQIELTCKYCNNKFLVWPGRSETAQFCSISCNISNRNKENARGYGETTIHHGRLKIKLPDHPYCDKSGYVFYHRHVVEKHLEYYLNPKEYDVHHIDEDKTNNALSNLVAIRRSAHMSLHASKRKLWEYSPR